MSPDRAGGALAPLQLLVVCTANQCRSPLGEALARHRLGLLAVPSQVCSAGTRAVHGVPATDDAIETARRLGLDMTTHRSRPIDEALISWTNLIVAMERQHVLELVTQHGAPLATTFTLPELAEFAAAGEPRRRNEDIADWLARITADRQWASVLGGSSGAGEIADPIGLSLKQYRDAAQRIDDGLAAVFGGMYGPGSDGPPE